MKKSDNELLTIIAERSLRTTQNTSTIKWVFIIALILGFVLSFKGIAQDTYRISPQSTVTIEGTSNIHDFEIISRKIDGGAVIEDNRIQSLTIIIPVKSFDSGKKKMNSLMYTALKARSYHNIEFIYIQRGYITENNTATVEGMLSIAGEENYVTVNSSASEGNSGFNVVGSYDLKQSNYKIAPVTALLGSIRVEDEVTVKFNITFIKQ